MLFQRDDKKAEPRLVTWSLHERSCGFPLFRLSRKGVVVGIVSLVFAGGALIWAMTGESDFCESSWAMDMHM